MEHYTGSGQLQSAPPTPRDVLRWGDLLCAVDATTDAETCVFLATVLAQDLLGRADPEGAHNLMDRFNLRADQVGWTRTVTYWRVAADAALESHRAPKALEHVERGLALAKDAGASPPSADDSSEIAALLLARARLRQQRGEIASARRDILRARTLDIDVAEVQIRLLLATADQCLLTEDHDLAKSSLANLATLPNTPLVRLYSAVILATMPERRSEAREALRKAHADAGLKALRQRAAGLCVQTALALGVTAEELRSEIELASHSCPVATQTKLVAARAEAWLRFGDDCGLTAAKVRSEVAVALSTSARSSISATEFGRLWNDDLAWLTNVAVRVHWRTSPGSDWQGSLAIALASESRRRTNPPSREQLEQLRREYAPARGALLVYLAGRFNSAVLVVTAESAEFRDDLPSIQAIRKHGEGALSDLRSTARGTPATPSSNSLTELSKALLPPNLVVALRPFEQLTIARIGRFEHLPFDALPVGERAAGETWAISHSTSLLEDVQRLAPAPAAHRDVHIVGSLAPAREIATSVGGAKQLAREHVAPCLALTDGRFTSDATPAKVLALGSSPRLLHVIGHGWSLSRGDVKLNAIALSPDPTHPDGLLFDAPLDWRAPPFVILSVCDHATTEAVRGEHTLHGAFAGACLRQGASAVLVPLGGVQLGPHLELLARVHTALSGGASLAGALRDARQALVPGMAPALRAQALLLSVHGNGNQVVLPTR